MAGEEGFEPSHAGIKIQCLNQLGDSPTQSVVFRPRIFAAYMNVKRILDYDLSKCSSGCLDIDCAFHAFQQDGIWLNTSSACSSLSKEENTQAPDPVILVSPNLLSHSMACAIGGKSFVATACKSFFP